MTPLDLTTLAADCEARAKAGEKPSDQWTYKPSEGHRYDFEGLIFVNPFQGKWYARWRPMVPAINRAAPLSSLPAAQLFAEALLAEATAPLHAARIAALEAALAEAKDAACAECNAHTLDGEQATRWNDLAVRWQDALAGDATKGSAE